jgi:hypothetical protein
MVEKGFKVVLKGSKDIAVVIFDINGVLRGKIQAIEESKKQFLGGSGRRLDPRALQEMMDVLRKRDGQSLLKTLQERMGRRF